MNFSKKIATVILLTYVFAVIVSGYVVITNNECLTEFLAFVAAPTAVILPFYFEKAKKENTVGGIKYDQVMKKNKNNNCE